MDKDDIPFLSATELAGLIETKEVSPVEATEAYLDRIDALDFKFNSYLTVCRKEALKAARDAEKAITLGNYLGPMHGIPVAVKDQFWSKGIRSTGGSRILADFIPTEDSTVVAKLKKAGAILLGKTNLYEFAMGRSQRYATPRNPWNLDMDPGGSSSGSGAATAAFLCATSLGEDTGGSIRNPASFCGLAGMKPSWGRVSRFGVMRGVWSMDTVGPMSRTVEDAAITLQAISGYDPRDPYTWNTPVPDYRRALDGNLKGLRLGLVVEQMNSAGLDPEVKESVEKATALIAELGASVDEVSLPLSIHSNLILWSMICVETAFTHRSRIRERLRDYGHFTSIRLLTGSVMPAQAYYKAQKLRSLMRRQVLEALESYDALLLPTTENTAQAIQVDPGIASKETALMPNQITPVFNAASAPAISVPCGLSSQGLPIGLQIGGRPGAEETVLKVAHAYEQSTNWHTMRPPEI